MAIYKLGELVELFCGSSDLTKNYIDKNKGIYPVISSKTSENGIYGYLNSFMFQKGITISKDGAYAGTIFYQKKPFSITSHAFYLKIKNKLILEKYLFFNLKQNENLVKKIGEGASTRNGISKSNLSNLKLKIPPLETQKSIIDIIETHEELFLKHNKLVRINNLENTKKDIQNLIDIIDPLERIKNNLELMENNIYKLFDYRTFSKKRIKDIISKINSGFSYKNSDKIDDGIYKIFKISNIRKNDDNNIDKTNFTKNNLLNLGDVITGLSGVLGTAKIIYEKYWVSNQRTLSLTSENFLLIKKSIEKNEKKIYTLSTGSVQKNITVNDILNLELLEENLCDNELNKIFLEINIVKGKILKLKNQILKII